MHRPCAAHMLASAADSVFRGQEAACLSPHLSQLQTHDSFTSPSFNPCQVDTFLCKEARVLGPL